MSSIRKPHPETAAAVKSGVVASLIETLIRIDPILKESLPKGSYCVRLKAPRGIGSSVSFNGGRRGTLLHFFSCRGMALTLSGGKAPLLPFPTGLSFIKGIKAFQKAASAVSAAMDIVPDETDEAGVHKKTTLLLTAALRGVCEVYNHDHWVKEKSASIPEGNIAVLVSGHPELSGMILLKSNQMSFKAEQSDTRANAVLEFADIEVCYGVLTGKLAAMGELGSGRVMVKGRLSMIQGLFPLLDRFGEIMK